MVAPQIVPDAPQSRQPPRRATRAAGPPPGSGAGYWDRFTPVPGKKIVRWVGNVPPGLAPWVDCDQPVQYAVSDAGEPFRVEYWRCRTTSTAKCKPCAGRHRRLVRRVAADGMRLPGAEAWFLTLTAQGDREHCKRKKCSSTTCVHQKCACTPPEGVDLPSWNASLGKRWNHFLVLFERHYGVRPDYFNAKEVQDGKRRSDQKGRGALHLHIPLRCGVRITKQQVRRLAIAAGFGCQTDLQPIPIGSGEIAKIATYVSKYVSKAVDLRPDVPWSVPVVDPVTQETSQMPARATYRTWSQSRSWGPTLTQLRQLDLARYRLQTAGCLTSDEGLPPAPAPGPAAAPAPDD